MNAVDSTLAEQGIPERGEFAVFAYGDPDDAYRLCGALATIAQPRAPKDAVVSRCLSTASSWEQRIEAIETLLDEGFLDDVVFIDPDALYPGEVDDVARWSDSLMRRERDELFRVLTRAGARHGWRYVQTAPSAPGLPGANGAQSASKPSPELRPAARWLGERSLISTRAWPGLSPDDIDHAVLAGLADSLDPALEQAAIRLALLRPVQVRNGTIGPYPRIATDRAVSNAQFADLAARGIVAVRGADFRMPRRLRRHFLALAAGLDAIDAPAEHRWLAKNVGPTNQVERHFHAVAGGDIESAKESSIWYTNDLRLATFPLTADSRFREAAAIYDFIRQTDEKDAYAHEYFGWNLWRNKTYLSDVVERTRIRDAYNQAHQLDPGNPLYYGRALGFRAECNENVAPELTRRIRAMTAEGRSEVAIKWFTQAALNGMVTGRREKDIEAVQREFGKTKVRSWMSRPSQVRSDA